MKPKLAIYFDTNIIDSRITRYKITLYDHKKILISQNLQSWLDLKKKYSSSIDIEYFIADITRQELKRHYLDSYNDLCSSITKLHNHLNDLGYSKIVRHSVEYKKNEAYEEWYDREFENFLKSNEIELAEEIIDLELFKSIISMSVTGGFPFRIISKEGRDVGFKDALLYMNISKVVQKFTKCILITKDNDFKQRSKSAKERDQSILIYNEIDEFERDLDIIISTEDKINSLLHDLYHLNNILSEIGISVDEYQSFKILSIEPAENDYYMVRIQIFSKTISKIVTLEIELNSKEIIVIEQALNEI